MGIAHSSRRGLSATDPGRSRLKLAGAIAAGMLLSALGAWGIVTLLHADAALLTVSVFLALQIGLVAKDATPAARSVTTALLIIPIAVAASLAVLLMPWRPLMIIIFVAVAGVSTWMRRFGPRATALGFSVFFGYFFPMLLQLTPEQFPDFLLVAAVTVTSLTLVRVLLMIERPERQLHLLLQELRSASAAALAAARQPEGRRSRALRDRLARIDGVARSITAWQQQFDTSRYVQCDETALASLVLDARMDIMQTCSEFVRETGGVPASAGRVPLGADPHIAAAVTDLDTILDNRAAVSRVHAAEQRASALLKSLDPGMAHRPILGRIAQSSLAHASLRSIARGREGTIFDRESAAGAGGAPAISQPAKTSTQRGAGQVPTQWWEWKQWRPTTRLAIQVMVAAAVATVVGEMISASRWYWAVLTAFIVFVGTSTRSGILTRAYGRVVGTAAGLAIGVGYVLLAHDQKPWLIAVCVLATFGMMYFGPIRYMYSAFFMSIVLVAMYGLIGKLDAQVLEFRIEETLAGAVIGVLCAYLIFSSNSHPALLSRVDGYFAALDGLVNAARTALTTPGQQTAVLASVHRLDAALKELETFTVGTSAAFLVPRAARHEPSVHMLYLCTRASGQLAQSAIAVSTAHPPQVFSGDTVVALDEGIDHLRATAQKAHASLESGGESVDPDDTVILDLLPRIPFDAMSPQLAAITNLSRINWVLEQIVLEQNRR